MISSRLKELVAEEINGALAQRHVREIINYHRALGSSEYHEAAEYLKRYLKSIGLKVTSIDAPLDNKTRAGNYILPYAWQPYDAILKVVSPVERTIVNFKEIPTCINSWSAATPPEGITAELVYVGDGTHDEDYQGIDVKGKVVLVDKGYNWRTHYLAVEKRGALGFINDDIREIPYAKTREMFPDFVLWNTLYEREMDGGQLRGWGLSISPAMGDYLRDLLKKGPVQVYAKVDTTTFEGVMENPMGIIEGSVYPEEEVLLDAHLCHTRPGAVDDAAGCAHITEIARVLNALIQRGDIPRPKRSIKFLYGPEGHDSNVYLHSIQDNLSRVIAGIGSHVGGDPEKIKGVFRLTKASAALPTFLNDLVVSVLEEVPKQFPTPGPGAKTPFVFEVAPQFMSGNSGQINGWGIPAVELGRNMHIYWHTQYDTLDKTSAEELEKIGWVGALVAYTIANAGLNETVDIMNLVETRSEVRLAEIASQARQELMEADTGDVPDLLARGLDHLDYSAERDSQAIASTLVLVRNEDQATKEVADEWCQRLTERLTQKKQQESDGLLAFVRLLYGDVKPAEPESLPAIAQLKPKMIRPGWIEMKRLTLALGEKYEEIGSKPGIMTRRGFLGYLYEILNLSNGERTIGDIARIIGYELEPLPIELIAEMVRDVEQLDFLILSPES